MNSIFEIAKWFLDKDRTMSNKKLQKLCWYAYSWYIALNHDPEVESNEFLFIDSLPEAWVHGPVFNELYADYKHGKYSTTFSAQNIESIEIVSFLENVWEVYGNNTGDELESISHQELPWINARKDKKPFEACRNKISIPDILTEYLPRIKR